METVIPKYCGIIWIHEGQLCGKLNVYSICGKDFGWLHKDLCFRIQWDQVYKRGVPKHSCNYSTDQGTSTDVSFSILGVPFLLYQTCWRYGGQ